MPYRYRFFFLGLLLGLCASPTPLLAQKLTFDHLTTEDGLPSNIIEVILQDHRGYLWFGSWFGEGLVRYDGYEMKVFRHVEGDSTSLSAGTVWDLLESDDETLWVGTEEGLSRFDASTETFKVYRHVEGDPASLSDYRVRALQETDDGTLWVGTFGGLNRFDASTGTFEVYRHIEGDATSLSNDRIGALQAAGDGTLWVGTADGLNHFDPVSGTFEVYRHAEGDATSLSDDAVLALLETEDGMLWVGTDGGLNRFDAATGTFKVYRHEQDDPTSLSHDQIWSLHQTDDGTLWVGTWGGGLNRFDASTETFEAFRPVAGDPTSLSHTQVRALYQTDDGVLWAGTWGGGLNRFDAATETFKVFRHEEDDPTSLSSDQVWALHESEDRTLWVGLWGGGLNRFDAAAGMVEVYRHGKGDASSLNEDNVIAIQETEDGTLWFGTADGGLYRFDTASKTVKAFRHAEGDATSLSDNWVDVLLVSNDGTLWVGTDDGLNRFDAATETFKVYRHVEGDATSLSDDRVPALLETGDGTLWVGTRSGLNRYDPNTDSFTHYRHDPNDSTSLSEDRVKALLKTDDGTLWVGTRGGGLNRLEEDPADPASISFTRFLADAGIRVQSLLEDEQGQLWLSTEGGRLVRFNPETGHARYFGKRYGLPAGSFVPGALLSRDGTLYWSNSSGLVTLNLDRLPPPGAPPKVHLTELWLFDEPLTPGPDAPLKQALWQTESLRLSHDQNDLTFGFVAIHYADPAENRYQYRLVGYDRDWRSETTQRRATYTNLPPGSYTFEVKAANSDGIWTEEPVRLGVEILPPWWRTLWAYMLYGLLLIAGIFGADRVQRRRLIRRERQRAEVAQERLRAEAAERELEQAREIEKAYTQLKSTQAQLIQSEKMASLGALTAGIAHEIKNPLNFVNNFAEVNVEIADELREAYAANPDVKLADLLDIVDDLKQNAEVINQHGKRADGIVHAMMQHASGGTGQRERADINQLVSEHIDLTYHGKRAQVPGLTVEIKRSLDGDAGTVEIVPQEIGRVLLNLLGNAFDAVHEKADAETGYAPTVAVTTRRNGETVEIRVADNGPGIDATLREKIFEPFFTTKPTGSGTGLGLSLSYDIVTQGHGGTLTVESTEGEGATFIITLPTDSST